MAAKIIIENPSKMVLEDKHFEYLIMGLIFAALGTIIILIGFGIIGSTTNMLGAITGGLIFIVAGGIILMFNANIRIEFDKLTGKGILTSSTILKREIQEIELKDIQEITIQKTIKHTKKTKYYYVFILNFVMKDNKTIPIELGRTSISVINFSSPDENMKRKGQQIAEFLGVPFRFTDV